MPSPPATFNGDGKLDLAVVDQIGGAWTLMGFIKQNPFADRDYLAFSVKYTI